VVTVDRYIVPVVLGYLAAFILAVLRPDLILLAIAGGNLVLFFNAMWVMQRFRYYYTT
jgi:hypothetical protein